MPPPKQPQAFLGSTLRYTSNKSRSFSHHSPSYYRSLNRSLANWYKSTIILGMAVVPLSTPPAGNLAHTSPYWAHSSYALSPLQTIFPPRANIAILTQRSRSVTCLNTLHLLHSPSSITIALSNDLPSIHSIFSYLRAANFPSPI